MSEVLKPFKRWSAQKKFLVALELAKGSVSLDEASRLTGQPAYVLSDWRDDLMNGGSLVFKEGDNAKEQAQADQITQLKAKIGDQAMEVDLLYEKVRKLEDGTPFHWRKLKK